MARGDLIIIRYADDFVVGFQYRQEAERFLTDLEERLARFQLALHPDKTRLIEFGRFARENHRKRGLGKPETFDFLGMTHFCDQSRKGRFRVGRKPSGKRVRRTLRRIREELRRRMHWKWLRVATWLGRVIRGWLNYYAVPGSFRWLIRFVHMVKKQWMRTLRRRSQKDRTSWEWLGGVVKLLWPKVAIRHPWPSERLLVRPKGGAQCLTGPAGISALWKRFHNADYGNLFPLGSLFSRNGGGLRFP